MAGRNDGKNNYGFKKLSNTKNCIQTDAGNDCDYWKYLEEGAVEMVLQGKIIYGDGCIREILKAVGVYSNFFSGMVK